MEISVENIKDAIKKLESVGAFELAGFFKRLLAEVESNNETGGLDAPMPLKIDKVAV